MTIYNPNTGHTKMVVDECITPYRKSCRGCKYSIDSRLQDGGCGLKYKDAWLSRHDKDPALKDVYTVITEALQETARRCNKEVAHETARS